MLGTHWMFPSLLWDPGLTERELELHVRGKVCATRNKVLLALQYGKVAEKSYYFKAFPLHCGHFEEGEGKVN